MLNRPRINGNIVVDQASLSNISLLGKGAFDKGVLVTTDQHKALYRLYEVDPSLDTDSLAKAASWRNTTRLARQDGMRVIAFLAKYCEPGQDPMSLIRLAMFEAGFDVTMEDEDEG